MVIKVITFSPQNRDRKLYYRSMTCHSVQNTKKHRVFDGNVRKTSGPKTSGYETSGFIHSLIGHIISGILAGRFWGIFTVLNDLCSDIMYPEHFVALTLCVRDVLWRNFMYPRRFVPGRLVTGRFGTGRSVGASLMGYSAMQITA